jgi:hypothetical protein
MQWYRLDLHLHTPGSADYQEPEVTYVDILRRAEQRGLDIIAFTDHNTVKGYDRMMQDIQQLELLVRLDRAQPEEKRRLAEYRRLLDRILVLPGFEFTATFGFHILGIFPPTMKVRQLEHVLLNLKLPPAVLEEGNSMVGASSDVLTAYREINNAGGIAIAAHVNSAHGVAMRGFDFGGQTKIAYTQDPYLHCLEVTDLEKRGRGTTSSFFNGTKPEYPRPMRCIQGSDAHRLIRDPRSEKNLGIGDRVTEALLPEKSFAALLDLFRGNDFARSRPYRGSGKDFYDHVHVAREAGPNIIQAFHDAMDQRSGKLYGIVADVCAFANTNGGTVYVGAAADITIPVVGVERISESIEILRDEINHKITPPLEVEIDALESSGKQVLRIRVPRGGEPPYAVDENRIYVREEVETVLAVRDEIVRLVQRLAPVPQMATTTGQAARPQDQRQDRQGGRGREQGRRPDRRQDQRPDQRSDQRPDQRSDQRGERGEPREGREQREPRGQGRGYPPAPRPQRQFAAEPEGEIATPADLPAELAESMAPVPEMADMEGLALNAAEASSMAEADAAQEMQDIREAPSDEAQLQQTQQPQPPGRRSRRGRGRGGRDAQSALPAQPAHPMSPAPRELMDEVTEAPFGPEGDAETADAPSSNAPAATSAPAPRTPMPPVIVAPGKITPPRTGVEIIGTETRKGEQYHMMRDLRNGNIVKNVTRQSARRLWHYAILERENNPVEGSRVQWMGVIGLWKRYKRGDVIRYDLVLKDNGTTIRVFYGVTEDGMHSAWQQFVSDAEPEIVLPDEG